MNTEQVQQLKMHKLVKERKITLFFFLEQNLEV